MKTKFIKIAFGIMSLLLVIFFVFATFFVQDKTASISSSYEARKEELLANQQQLESLILELNKTLQIVQESEQNLSNQVAILENRATQQVTAPAPIQTQPTPAPVTRAS